MKFRSAEHRAIPAQTHEDSFDLGGVCRKGYISLNSYLYQVQGALLLVQQISLVSAMKSRPICVRGIGISGPSGDTRSSRPYDRSPSSCADRPTWQIYKFPTRKAKRLPSWPRHRRTGWVANGTHISSVRFERCRTIAVRSTAGRPAMLEERPGPNWHFRGERACGVNSGFPAGPAVGGELFLGLETDLGYLWKTQMCPNDTDGTVTRPPYKLIDAQADRFDRLDDFVLQILQGGPLQSEEEQQQVDRQLLDLIVQLLDHPIPNTAYDSILISALAALGGRRTGGGRACWATHRRIRPPSRSPRCWFCSSRGLNASNRAGGRRRRTAAEGCSTSYERRCNGL